MGMVYDDLFLVFKNNITYLSLESLQFVHWSLGLQILPTYHLPTS